MLRRVLAPSRYIMVIAVIVTFVGALALIIFEAIVMAAALFDVVREGSVSANATKVFAVRLIESVDVFLIAVAVYIISLGFYVLFVDDKLPLPRWLEIHDLEGLKGNLVSVVIAVLAVLFLREAVVWNGGYDLASFGAALALVVAALTFFLTSHAARKP